MKKCLHMKKTKNRKKKPEPQPVSKYKKPSRPRSLAAMDGGSMAMAAAMMLAGHK